MNSADPTQFDQIREADLAAVRQRFWARGETIAEWAASNGFSPATTYSLLAGRLRARRGEAHRIAVALGLKPAPTLAGQDAETTRDEGAKP
ncbi:DNA-binding protein [Rhodocyclus tenuis]|uniref:Gp16 family phage-associated protein n=1 Tax=Rhodocyclus tenuis TaxID=1066 RepID=A0A840GC58_RHOTE|nr:DNA-binding protein [Rhodocyclus tenuis]MBB4245839.1 gp16 family phage-associated protein [Rhodocyclus tenuis]